MMPRRHTPISVLLVLGMLPWTPGLSGRPNGMGVWLSVAQPPN